MKTIEHGDSLSYELDMFDLIRAVRAYLRQTQTHGEAYSVPYCDISVHIGTYISEKGEELIHATGVIRKEKRA